MATLFSPSVELTEAMTVSPAEETVAIATSSNQLLTSLGEQKTDATVPSGKHTNRSKSYGNHHL